jgi:hypothetical protein
MAVIVQALLALGIFFCLNWIGRHSSHLGYETPSLFDSANGSVALNFIIRTFAPVIITIIISSLMIKFGMGILTDNIHQAVYVYFGLRVGYVVLWGRGRIVSWPKIAFQIIVGCYSAWWAYDALIKPQDPLFPDLNTIGNELWLAIAAFVYAMINGLETSPDPSTRRTNAYIFARYRMLSKKYGHLISGKMTDIILEPVLYAILVVEDYNRPGIVRWVERLWPSRKPKTLGIAQIKSLQSITDLQSVELARDRINDSFQSIKKGSDKVSSMGGLLNEVIGSYNKDINYIEYVWSIAEVISVRVETSYAMRWKSLWDEELK